MSYKSLGLVGPLPKDATSYPQGYKSQSFWGKVNVVDKTLRVISGKRMQAIKVALQREFKGVESGKLKAVIVDGHPVVMERRQRVGKYFSANGGKIEPSKVTVIRMTRASVVKTEAVKPYIVASVPREENVEAVNKITYLSEGYGKTKFDSKDRIAALPAQKSAFEKMRELLGK